MGVKQAKEHLLSKGNTRLRSHVTKWKKSSSGSFSLGFPLNDHHFQLLDCVLLRWRKLLCVIHLCREEKYTGCYFQLKMHFPLHHKEASGISKWHHITNAILCQLMTDSNPWATISTRIIKCNWEMAVKQQWKT